MDKKKGLCALAIVVGALSAAPAMAVPLLNIETTPGPWTAGNALPLGGPHDVAITQGRAGWYAANLVALEDVQLTFTYLGKEAAWTNAVFVGGSQLFSTASAVGTSADGGGAGAGSYVDFLIKVVSGGNSPHSVTNGSNVAPQGVASGTGGYGAPNFWLGYVDASQASVYVAFDDGGGGWQGKIDDDDHDDLVFRIDAVAVPEPGSLALLGASLLGLGFARRRMTR